MAKKTVLRMCVACSQRRDKSELYRIVKNKEEEIMLAISGHAEGRGMYVCKTASCVSKLEKCSKRIHKSFKEALPLEIRQELLQHVANSDE